MAAVECATCDATVTHRTAKMAFDGSIEAVVALLPLQLHAPASDSCCQIVLAELTAVASIRARGVSGACSLQADGGAITQLGEKLCVVFR